MKTGTGLTARGWTILGTGIAWCLVAAFIGQRDLWWPGLFLILLPLSSMLLLVPGSTRLRATRRIDPPRVTAKETVRVDLLIDPHSAGVGGPTRARDRLAPALGEARWHEAPARLGRWQQRFTYELRPGWRGRHRVGPAERIIADGLGLATISTIIPGTTDLLVTPSVEPLANLAGASGMGMASDATVLRTGLGAADDVLIREYRHGDDVRRIHWRSTARTGALMVRREERSWDPSATVLIDNRSIAYSHRIPDDRLEWAVSAAASIAIHLLSDGFDLTLVEADGTILSPHRAVAGRESLVLEQLADLKTHTARTLGAAFATSARGAEGQLLIAILGRVDEADIVALTNARRQGRTCCALVVGATPELAVAAAERVRAAGWRCAIGGPGTSVAEAWRALDGGDFL
ncbi:MAG: DUF58 domain-containing protein [Propionicimonas sp.]